MQFGEMPGGMPGKEIFKNLNDGFKKKRDELREEIEEKRRLKERSKEMKRARKSGERLSDPTHVENSEPDVESKVVWKKDEAERPVSVASSKVDFPVKKPIEAKREIPERAGGKRIVNTLRNTALPAADGFVQVDYYQEMQDEKNGELSYAVRFPDNPKSYFFKSTKDFQDYLDHIYDLEKSTGEN